jgi:small subunit ribosomal protein S20
VYPIQHYAIKFVRDLRQVGGFLLSLRGYAKMQKELDQAVSKGLMHKNQAARKKSRLNTQIKAL